MNTNLTLNELLHKHGIASRWTFSTYYRGVNSTSPRVFENIEDALHAVMEKLRMHAVDGEFPMISLLAIPTPAGRPLAPPQRDTHTCEDV